MGSIPTFGTSRTYPKVYRKALYQGYSPVAKPFRAQANTQTNTVGHQGAWSAKVLLPPACCARPVMDSDRRRFLRWPPLLIVALMISALCVACGGDPKASDNSLAGREQQAVAIATEYAETGDLAKAEARLAALNVPKSQQWLAALAERYMRDSNDPVTTGRLVSLSMALGVTTVSMARYAKVHFSPTPGPAVTATPEATEAPLAVAPPTATAAPAPTLVNTPVITAALTLTNTPEITSTATLTPTTPPAAATPFAVVNADSVNVRSGPSTDYPVQGRLDAGASVAIVGKNVAGDWWKICCVDGNQGWVKGSLVEGQGDLATVLAIADVPPPPPTQTPQPTSEQPTAAPQAPAPAATAAPPPGVSYVVKSVRLKSVGEDAQSCTGGDHNIFVVVQDAAGAPLDGVRVREVFSGQIQVTGSQGKGPGRAMYDIYRGGGGQVDIVDDAGNRISELSRGMSDDWPEFDLMKAAGYCNCKPHLDDASCQADMQNKTYFFAVGHYAFVVIFQRTW